MGDSSPPSPGLCEGFKQEPVPRAKRLSDSAVQVQALQSAKKACVLRRGCSTPDPAGHPLFPSPGSGCSLFLDESGQEELGASFSMSKYNDVAISLDISRCFDDSELDDSLLELSGSEKGSSPFDYTEEEIQEILAEDSMEAEQQQHLTGESHLSQSASGESDKAESNCTPGTSVSELASEVTEEPKEAQEPLSGSSGCDPGFLTLDGTQLQQELDLDLQELLSLSPFTAACTNEALEENNLEGETLDAMIDDCLGYSTAAGSCIPEKPTEEVMPKGRESQDCPGKSNLPCGQSVGDEGSAFVLPPKKELPKAAMSCSSRKSGSPEDAERESTGAEQPSDSTKVNSHLHSCHSNVFNPIPLDLSMCTQVLGLYRGGFSSGSLYNSVSKTYMEKFYSTLIPFSLPFPVKWHSCRPDWAGRATQWAEKWQSNSSPTGGRRKVNS